MIPLGQNPARTISEPRNPTRKSAFGRTEFPNTPAFDRILSNHSKPKSGSSSLVHVQPALGSNQARCSRCLAQSHTRNSCRNAIKCLACHGWGHVAATCLNAFNSKGKAPVLDSTVSVARSRSPWFCGLPNGPSSSRPLIFQSFGALVASLNTQGHLLIPRQPVIVNWCDPSASEAG